MNARAKELVAEDVVRDCVLEADAGLEAIRTEWQALSLASHPQSCFATPAYFRAWCDTLSGDVTPFLLAARRGGRLIGVMPMMRAQVRRGPLCAPRHDFAPADREYLGEGRARPIALRQLSPIVSMPATWVAPAPLCLATDRGAVISAMADQIARLSGWDSLALPVDAGDGQSLWHAALVVAGLHPWVHELGRQIGAISVVEPFAAKVARHGWKFRQNIRRAEAAAEKAGLSVTVYEGYEAVIARMPQLAAVAEASWKQTGREGAELTIPYAGRQQRFFKQLLDLRDEDLTPVLCVATCGDQPVAALLCLRHGDSLTALVTFRTDAVPNARPGLKVMARMVDWAHEQGLARFDLNASSDWTRHLVDERRAENIIVCFAPTPRGQLLRLVSAATRRVRR